MITRDILLFSEHFPTVSRAVSQLIARLVGLMCAVLLASCSQPLPFPPIKPLSKLIVLSPIGPLSYEPPTSGDKKGSGFGYDLVAEFAASQGLEADFQATPITEIADKLAHHNAHLAVGWMSNPGQHGLIAGSTIAETHDVLVQHQATPPIRNLQGLSGKTVHAISGSHAGVTLSTEPKNNAHESSLPFTLTLGTSEDPFALLEKVANQEIEFAVIDKATFSIALNYFPNLDSQLRMSQPYPICWLFPAKTAPSLIEKANEFIYANHETGNINRLLDRYLGHVQRLTPNDNAIFLERIKTVLPGLKSHFTSAQEQTGIDWRLLAAIAYRESGWDPLATSPTNVRGIMMLTEDTASRLGVSDRLDARQSILAGARYLQMQRRKLPKTTPEPDRTWQALAAYNLGLTNLLLGRQFAEQNNYNPDSWYDMKKALPRFARTSRARGGEAVIMVESIRLLYDTIKRHEAPHIPRHNKGKSKK